MSGLDKISASQTLACIRIFWRVVKIPLQDSTTRVSDSEVLEWGKKLACPIQFSRDALAVGLECHFENHWIRLSLWPLRLYDSEYMRLVRSRLYFLKFI